MADRERVLSGVVAADGLVVGTIQLDRNAADTAAGRTVGDPAAERMAFDRARRQARDEIGRLIAGADKLAAEILEFQEALLDDVDILDPVQTAIANGQPAHEAWADKLDTEIGIYRTSDNEYLAARAEDLHDLRDRVLRAFVGADDTAAAAMAAAEANGGILVADSLTPSRFIELDWSRLAGAAVRDGSRTSHVAILARARGVPLIVGLDATIDAIPDRSRAVLDAECGRLVLAPSPATLRETDRRIVAARRLAEAAEAVRLRPAMTASGETVRILLNLDDPALLDGLDPASVDGIGLVRTEFLFRGGALPDEDAQLAAYRRIVHWAKGRPVTFRTLDAGGDKPIPGVTPEGESNPFLGVRGLRLSLQHEPIFEIQLRALCRVAAEGPIKIMLPMVTLPSELAAACAILDRVVTGLKSEGVDHATPPLGMMVEVPTAAIMAERFDADFYSIGSNDLVQYATASARDNPAVAALAEPDNPAIYALIRMTVDAAARREVEVSLCGDMASDPALTTSLLDCGLRSLSVAPPLVGRIKLAVATYPDRSAA